MSKVYTADEVAQHKKEGDLWIVIDSKVYDLSKFAQMHPGGVSVLVDEEVAGKDATEIFFSLHRQEVLDKPQFKRLVVGTLQGAKQVIPREPGSLSKDHHRAFTVAYRKFVDEVIVPDAQLHEEDGKRPSQHLNIIAMRMGPGLIKGLELMGGMIKPEEFDYFHEMIMGQETARVHARGYTDGLGGGTYIGLPPIMNFGQPALREKICKEVFAGKKFCSLAITEAFAGSDGWIVNGTKKWITNATFADYFTVGCRTEQGGLVVLLVERGEGVETKAIKTSYSTAAGTAYITFENVFVPYEHTLGKENKGLQVILSNFNHERWGMCTASIASQRLIVEECLKWANQRKVFGKPLHSQAVIRAKLAAMISRRYATSTAQETARDAVQVFGGRGITRTGMGRFIEHYHRTVPFDAVLGGAEDVLGDLGVRQALRKMPKDARL
ncbi:acyl-CoA dehydrogenase [Coprinopsis sp. MPI-PUGE-AT-0042]|nr:acyl-CoA dehydrogenase [Coprinopsis sp. MPI-PUGE-AT-0042]